MGRMISTISEYVQKDPQLALYAEHMNTFMIDNDSILKEFKNMLSQKYTQPHPRLLVLLGSPAFTLRDEYRKLWGDIPIVLCSEEAFQGPHEAYLQKQAIKLKDRTPIAQFSKPYNMVFLYSELYLRENVQLINHIKPNIKKFIFIGDKREVNLSASLDIQNELRVKNPKIEYQFLTPQKMTTNQLLDSLYRVDPQTTGILFASWFYKTTFAGNTSLMSNDHKLIVTTPAPIFTLNMTDITEENGGMIGGYTYNQKRYSQELVRTISDILQGKQARDLPFYMPSDGAPIINYTTLLRKGLSPSMCPADTYFLHKPLSFWELNKYFIMGSLSFIFLLALFFFYHIHNLNIIKSIIENNNTLLLQLISDILDLSKIEAGTLDFNYSNVEINDLMSDLENSCQLKLKSDKVKLEFIAPEQPCCAHIEKNRLSQLIINLVTNAIKFTTEGSIRFGYKRQKDELYFYVADTGCGIPKDKQDSIFGRFVKLNSFAQGTGLGLSICRTLVDNMGGKIGVESEEGKGSTFWFTLPYKEASNIIEKAPQKEIQTIAIEKDKLIILVAEDNESNYKLFESILKYDYHLIHAWDGQEAVNLFKEYNPQIVLMDINMPVMDGYEATKEIRKYSAKVPIIAITAFAFASDEQRVMESGFDGYMPKPINANLLKAQLKDIMQKRIILL